MKTFPTVLAATTIALCVLSLAIGAEASKPSFDIPRLVRMNISQIKKELGKPSKEITEVGKMKLHVWTAEWKKAPVTLQADYYPSGKIKSIFIFESKGTSFTKQQLLSHGNIDEKSKNYKVNVIKDPFSKVLASIEVVPFPKKRTK